MIRTTIAIAVMCGALPLSAQTAKDIRGATELVALDNEPPAKLIVDPPIPAHLANSRTRPDHDQSAQSRDAPSSTSDPSGI